MFNIQSFFLRAVLALAIAVGAPSALAGPIYRVSLDTAKYAGTTGYLDLSFNGAADAVPGFAYVSNLVGDFTGGESLVSGNVRGNAADGIRLGTGPDLNFFDLMVRFGSTISFDVRIDDLADGNGILFAAALLDDSGLAYLAGAENLFSVDVVGGQADAVVVADDTLVQFEEVPEPADWLLVASGLALITFTRRMHKRR